MINVFDSVENYVRKGENAGYQHFLLFPQSFIQKFQELFPQGISSSGLFGKRLNTETPSMLV